MDALTRRLAEALRELAEDITHEDHEPGDWSVQAALRMALEALAAYDERVAAEGELTAMETRAQT